MMGFSYRDHLKQLVLDGVFSEEVVDTSVMRLLQLKKDLGLFDDPFRYF